jgi:hypothetical protein
MPEDVIRCCLSRLSYISGAVINEYPMEQWWDDVLQEIPEEVKREPL